MDMVEEVEQVVGLTIAKAEVDIRDPHSARINQVAGGFGVIYVVAARSNRQGRNKGIGGRSHSAFP